MHIFNSLICRHFAKWLLSHVYTANPCITSPSFEAGQMWHTDFEVEFYLLAFEIFLHLLFRQKSVFDKSSSKLAFIDLENHDENYINCNLSLDRFELQTAGTRPRCINRTSISGSRINEGAVFFFNGQGLGCRKLVKLDPYKGYRWPLPMKTVYIEKLISIVLVDLCLPRFLTVLIKLFFYKNLRIIWTFLEITRFKVEQFCIVSVFLHYTSPI